MSEKNLTSHLTDRTCETIEATMDEVVKKKVEEDEDIVICEILRDFARTTKPPYSLSDIEDEVSSRRQSIIKKKLIRIVLAAFPSNPESVPQFYLSGLS